MVLSSLDNFLRSFKFDFKSAINSSRSVSILDLYLLNSGTNYSATEQLYDDANPTNPYNMYKLDNSSFINIPKIINLEYTINKIVNVATPTSTTYNIIINLSSKFKIPRTTSIEFFFDGLNYVSSRINNIQNLF